MIDLLPDSDQQALIENFRAVLISEAPLSRLRAGSGDDGLIARLAALGWIGLGVSEAGGGVGLGLAEEILLFREAGRCLVGPGLLASVLAAHVAVEAGDMNRAASLISGERGAALVARDGRHRFDRSDGDISLWIDTDRAVLGDAAGEAVAGIDPTVKLERLAHMPSPGLVVEGRRPALHAALLVSASLAGLAEAARDMAVAYAKDREQFGQPIGAFQAIKHRCADMAVGCEAGWMLTVFAALALAEGRTDAAFQIASARIVTGEAALAATRANIQIHGGMGFTDECDANLLVKRCHLWLQAAGDTRSHKALLMAEPEPVRGG